MSAELDLFERLSRVRSDAQAAAAGEGHRVAKVPGVDGVGRVWRDPDEEAIVGARLVDQRSQLVGVAGG